jgi:hypothetical protein
MRSRESSCRPILVMRSIHELKSSPKQLLSKRYELFQLELLEYFNADREQSEKVPLRPHWTFYYYWGPAYEDGSHLTHEICCDGVQVRVTTTLYNALLRIRQLCSNSKLDRGLWVDALSIN